MPLATPRETVLDNAEYDVLYINYTGENTLGIIRTPFYPNQYYAGPVRSIGDPMPLRTSEEYYFASYKEAMDSLFS